MSISPRNLWPEDIAVTGAVAPVAILKEQASLLGERTKNLVEGRVSAGVGTDIDKFLQNTFTYDFDLVAPALNSYRYRLLSMTHDAEAFYPLTIASAALGSDRLVRINNEEELLKALEAVFSSDKTRRVIGSLLAQSRA